MYNTVHNKHIIHIIVIYGRTIVNKKKIINLERTADMFIHVIMKVFSI